MGCRYTSGTVYPQCIQTMQCILNIHLRRLTHLLFHNQICSHISLLCLGYRYGGTSDRRRKDNLCIVLLNRIFHCISSASCHTCIHSVLYDWNECCQLGVAIVTSTGCCIRVYCPSALEWVWHSTPNYSIQEASAGRQWVRRQIYNCTP